MAKIVDWVKAREDFINNKNCSLIEISRKNLVSYTRVKVIAKREQWVIKKERLWKNAEKDALEESEGSIKDLIKRHSRMARYLQAIAIKELQERMRQGKITKESMDFLVRCLDRGMVLEAALYPKTLQITGEVGLTAETIPEELKEAIYEIYRKKTTGRKRPSIHRGNGNKGVGVRK